MKKTRFSWKKLFGSKQSKTAIPDSKNSDRQQQSTLDHLRELEDLLQRKQNHLETSIEALIAEARKHGTKNKRAALLALKRKKRLEAELLRIDGTLTTLELQREALESAKNNLQVLGAMKDAANVLKNAQKHVTADKVLDIMDEVNEQQEIAREIADAMSNPIAANSMVDEAELERELEALEQEELDKALLKTNGATSSDLPPDEVPVGSDEKKETNAASDLEKDNEKVDEDEKELLELAQWST